MYIKKWKYVLLKFDELFLVQTFNNEIDPLEQISHLSSLCILVTLFICNQLFKAKKKIE